MNTERQNTQCLGKYEFRERLGCGGMAEVWKAFDSQLQRHVALKILHADLQHDPNFITRFEREARVIASLHHPNIVQIHDFQITHSPESNTPTAYMVMDYVEGTTLAAYIRATSRKGELPPATDIIHLFASVGRAIDYAHQKGMVHRDIKPANILLDKRHMVHNTMGEPILTDFGIVKLLGTTTGTLSGTWLGTPLYISPEQAQGNPGNERSDIYSLGVILYEICTGVQPFHGDTIAAIMMQHINSLPTSPTLINPAIPPALTMVILRCLAKDPTARFSSASALTAALAEALTLPIPAGLSLPTYPMEEMSAPTYVIPVQPSLALSMGHAGPTPTSPPVQMIGAVTPPQCTVRSTPQSFVQASVELGTAITPMSNTGGNAPHPDADLNASAVIPKQSPSKTNLPAPHPTSSTHTSRWLRIGLIALLISIVGATLSTFLLFLHPPFVPPVSTGQILGHVRFLSSGQLYVNNNQGINDELEIDLQFIPDPTPGKSYYTWLLPDRGQSEAAPLFLSRITVTHGVAHFLYSGDPQHTDLLTSFSRFLITEEDAQTTPSIPSLDNRTWRYYAEIPQKANPADTKFHFSMLDHLRHLLSGDPTIESVGLPGGLNIWLLRNTEEILTWSIAAKDHWESKNSTSVRQKILNILYYLDGDACIEPDVHNVPLGTLTAPEVATIDRIARVPLLDTCSQPHISGYIHHLGLHLLGVAQSSGVTQGTRDAAARINRAIENVNSWLEQIRHDAVQLIDMTNEQLTQSAALDILAHLAMEARYAYAGRMDPSTGAWQGGVTWVYSNMQGLVVFDVTVCSNTSTVCF